MNLNLHRCVSEYSVQWAGWTTCSQILHAAEVKGLDTPPVRRHTYSFSRNTILPCRFAERRLATEPSSGLACGYETVPPKRCGIGDYRTRFTGGAIRPTERRRSFQIRNACGQRSNVSNVEGDIGRSGVSPGI